VDIYPCQPPVIEGQSANAIPFTKDESFYQRDEFYPPQLIQLGEPAICRDLRLMQVTINPVQYNPVSRQLKVYTNIDYTLVYGGTDTRNVKVRRDNHISESFLPLYRSLVPNADEMLASYEPIKGGYLILTPSTFPDSLIQLLARWKHLKGYSIAVVKDTSITHGGTPSSTQVFDFIQNAYNTWTIPPEYVCIMGDLNVSFPSYGYNGYTSDHPYSCVDGSDYFSDVMVTRMSVPNSNAVIRTAIYKDLIYEKSPYMGDTAYWLRGLSVAGNITSGGAPTYTPRLVTLWVRQALMEHGFTRVDTSFAWDSYNPGPAQITASINNGVSIISYRGWAGPQGWYDPTFGLDELNALSSNNKMGVMASLVCGTGDFGDSYYSECFGERWIRMGSLPSALKGGPGFYGVTDHSTHTKFNNPIMIGYYWAILEQGIYNLATAAFTGKMHLFETYPRNNGPGSYIQQYFYTYNTLGDPELEIRTAIPQTMIVTYPNPIPVGSSYMTVHVTGTGGTSLANAYVNLVKGRASEEVFVGGRTNASGDITLNFATTVADTMFVTVTARNYIPHLGNTLVQAQPVAVNISAIALDDDNTGNSHGNSDGNINPSETIEFDVTLRNFGTTTTATDVSATLASSSPDIFITVPTQSFGTIAPGATATSAKFAALMALSIPHGEHYILQLNITSNEGSWTAAVPIDIFNMEMLPQAVTYPGNANNRIDPGETSQLAISLKNVGGLAGASISGLLTTADTGIVILNGTANFGDIAIGATGSNAASPFSVQAHAGLFSGHNTNFDLALTSSNGSVAHRPFSIVIGNVNTYDPIGPDDYGYYIYDNTDGAYVGCPTYNWVDISTIGTRINFPFSTDDDARVDSVPFDFTYYGQIHRKILVSINGFIAFDTTRYDGGGHHWNSFDNSPIPEPGAPDGLIGPFWDDLEYTAPNGVFRYNDSANHRFIIEWKGMTHPRSGTTETFEMIIFDQAYYPTPTGDCEIVFQYNTVHNDDYDGWDSGEAPGLFATVGMQNIANNDGLMVTYDSLYYAGAAPLQSGRALKITTVTSLLPPPDITLDPNSFIKNGSVGQIVYDTLQISNIGGSLLNFSIAAYADHARLLDHESEPSIPAIQSISEPIDYIKVAGSKPGDEIDPLYPPVILNSGGPDGFGNKWVDSDEPGGPTYSWVDISSLGTTIPIPSDDAYAGPFTIGFSFPFYGNSYSTLYVSANGILTFGSGTSSYSNQAIPNATDPNNFIAPLWDDLSPQNGGTVKYYSDVANNRFIVSYVNTPFYTSSGGTGSVNFEAILYSDGQIQYVYASIDGGTRGLNSLTIGIENSGGTDGLQVVYNALYLHSNMAIQLYPPCWFSSSINTGSLLAGHDTLSVIAFDATGLLAGSYNGHLAIASNDLDERVIDLPVSFTVGGTGNPNIVQTPASFTDTLQTGNTAPFNIKVKNTGTASLTVAFSPSAAWITTAAGPYNIAAGDSIIHSVTLSAVGLTPAVYNSSLVTNTNDPAHPSVTMPIQLRVTAPPPPNIVFYPAVMY
ncbi:MAG TPA: hypothetical protein DCZ43_02575, partial [candidate division Zixibacteria bacterium]|nr:hypothetical protein [candidate division Zixibacteria bacterium]